MTQLRQEALFKERQEQASEVKKRKKKSLFCSLSVNFTM